MVLGHRADVSGLPQGETPWERVTIAAADVVLVHTGEGGLWGNDNARFLSDKPGPGLDLVRWLYDRRIAALGSDSCSSGPVPGEDPERPFLAPQTMYVKMGLFGFEAWRRKSWRGAVSTSLCSSILRPDSRLDRDVRRSGSGTLKRGSGSASRFIRGWHLPALLVNLPNHQEPTLRRQTRILVDIHPRTSGAAIDWCRNRIGSLDSLRSKTALSRGRCRAWSGCAPA